MREMLFITACLLGLFALLLPMMAAEPTSNQPRLDRGKTTIIEPSLAAMLAKQAQAKAASEALAKQQATVANPKVQAGKVNWHKDFATASAAAQKSEKPVLLFQLLGNLDEQFC